METKAKVPGGQTQAETDVARNKIKEEIGHNTNTTRDPIPTPKERRSSPDGELPKFHAQRHPPERGASDGKGDFSPGEEKPRGPKPNDITTASEDRLRPSR